MTKKNYKPIQTAFDINPPPGMPTGDYKNIKELQKDSTIHYFAIDNDLIETVEEWIAKYSVEEVAYSIECWEDDYLWFQALVVKGMAPKSTEEIEEEEKQKAIKERKRREEERKEIKQLLKLAKKYPKALKEI